LAIGQLRFGSFTFRSQPVSLSFAPLPDENGVVASRPYRCERRNQFWAEMDRHIGTGLALAQVDGRPGDVRPFYLD
jgi:hypothetical protein